MSTGAVPEWLTDYMGIPFKEKGRTHDGCDCWGIVRLILGDRYGVRDLPDFGDTYSSTTNSAEVARAVQTGLQTGWQRIGHPEAGALVVLRLAGRPWHCGVMVNATYMLHALEGAGTVLERIWSPLWSNRIEGFYRAA